MSPSTNCSITASTSSSSEPVAEGCIPFDAAAAASPCTRCGACCAQYRVSFYWAEADDAPGGWVPVQWTRPLNAHLRAMAGTEGARPRCAALVGEVGQHVGCAIYAQRPSTCREFDWRGADGAVDARCNEARRRVGLPELVRRGAAWAEAHPTNHSA